LLDLVFELYVNFIPSLKCLLLEVFYFFQEYGKSKSC